MHNGARAAQADQHVFLIGRPPVSELIGYVRTLAANSRDYDDGEMIAEWRAANDRVLQLEESEPNLADDPEILPLPPELEPLGEAAMANPVFQRAFRLLPMALGIVELDRMVVFQKHIDLSHVRKIRERLGEMPSPEDIFRLCIPLDPEAPSIRVMQNAPNSYTFVSQSCDLRYLESMLLDVDQVEYGQKGAAATILGVVVGYGSNCLTGLLVENRLVLANGSHRAFALREQGITHVPCVVQKISRREELELIGPAQLCSHPELFLEAARPPLLKDYFDPRLRKIIPVVRKNRVLKISFSVETSDIPAY